MEKNIEYGANKCKNVFTSDLPDIRGNFTSLWLQVICKKEGEWIIKKDRQTVS